ncbi:YheC/YheD family protein [Bacillus sp. Marseille-Q1617]|uniref:YheC/YheD family endospore coat-associated protein n=1 Tax=Bacillus sp. Marseille-Q1617 TaxID=2736887 RepID=UPI00158B8C22|nr:YheC/YheD family protein [Bacillus sp. Marseille-Q1617]
MNIYYDLSRKIFFHGEESLTAVPFAKDSFLLSSKGTEDAYTFKVQSDKKILSIPLVGIVAGKDQNKYKGNFELFRSIQQEFEEQGGICFVFSPEDAAGHSINGIIFNEEVNKWVKCVFPLPNVIYNRIPSREAEQQGDYIKLKEFIKTYNIPYFNPHFFNKWEVHQILSQCGQVRDYLPPTSLVENEESFTVFLEQHKRIYVKPSFASQGRGIRLVELEENGSIICKSIKKIEKYTSLSRFLYSYHEWFHSEQNLIMQKAIPCKTLHDHRFDYRILVLHTGEEFKLMGIGVRISQRQEVTTHVPAGGKIISIQEVATPQTKKEILTIVKTCGRELERAFGYVGEFSVDLAPREEGGFVLFEVNSKPMTFDEEDIETKRRRQLVRTFLRLSVHKEG